MVDRKRQGAETSQPFESINYQLSTNNHQPVWRNAVDLRHLPEGTHCLANRPGSLARLAFQKWSAWGDLHSQGCSGLSRTGLLFPVNHTPVGAPGLAPGRLSDLKSLGSAVPSEARRREIGGHEGTCTPKAARF